MILCSKTSMFQPKTRNLKFTTWVNRLIILYLYYDPTFPHTQEISLQFSTLYDFVKEGKYPQTKEITEPYKKQPPPLHCTPPEYAQAKHYVAFLNSCEKLINL